MGLRYENAISGISLRSRIARAMAKTSRRGRAVRERALRGGLDDRTVGDRIGERDAELDRVGAGGFELFDDADGVAVAAGDVGDEAAAASLSA